MVHFYVHRLTFAFKNRQFYVGINEQPQMTSTEKFLETLGWMNFDNMTVDEC